MKQHIQELRALAAELSQLAQTTDIPYWIAIDAATNAGRVLRMVDRLEQLVEGMAA
jgi:hypothetical protein